MARAVRAGPRRRYRLSRQLVGERERAMEKTGSGAATRRPSSGATASSSRPPTTAGGGVGARLPPRRRHAAVGGVRARRHADTAHPKNGHASATPATDGERVYASFGSRGLLAVDFDGKLVWQRDLGAIDNYHGTAGSPLLYKDRLILFQDQSARRVHRGVRHAHRPAVVATPRDASRSAGARRSPSASAITTRSSSAARSRVQAYNPDTGARAVDAAAAPRTK